MRARKDKFPFLNLRAPWASNPNAIWLASTLGLHRNLKAYLFPPKLGGEERMQVLQTLSTEVLKAPQLANPVFIRADETGPLEKEFLFEHFLARKSFQQALAGEGFIFDDTGSLLALLNVRNHLQLQITDVREELEKPWNQLVQIESFLNTTLGFAFNPRFGFLTADPHRCGTGLVARAFLHLPALIRTGKLSDVLDRLGEGEVEVMSIQGGLDEMVGDLVTVTNRCTIGLNDEQLLQSVRSYVLKLIAEEKEQRQALRNGQSNEMKDHVSRAFGLLRHSYRLETQEAWGAISLLKLGLDLGWVKGTSQEGLNELLFSTRRAHLVSEYTDELSQEELPHKRAEFIHAHLTDADLTI